MKIEAAIGFPGTALLACTHLARRGGPCTADPVARLRGTGLSWTSQRPVSTYDVAVPVFTMTDGPVNKVRVPLSTYERSP